MLFGSSGIRRKFDQTLIDTALRVGSALAFRSSDVVIGMDTRTTSPLLVHLVTSGIIGSGGRAHTTGIAPTPSVAYYTRKVNAGCMVTASHNPEEYNGLKLFNPNGSSFTQEQQVDMEELLKSRYWTDWQHQGGERSIDALTPHKKAILESVHIKPGITVVVDCGNGAGCMLTPDLLATAGAKIHCINCNPSGHFARPSEPLKENLGNVGEMVKKTGSACAVVHDRYLDAKHVVTTSDASMIIEDIAEVKRTPVGDTYVSEELLKWGDFGGEPSGAWIFPKISYCPDGPFAAALFCEIASEWNVSEELDAMPSYPILRESFACDTARETVLALGATSPTDGIRIAKEDGWFLIRASGTEPKIRITAEAKSPAKAKEMLKEGRDLVKQGKTA
jgi:phosphoglucosamine mutase